jgi:hypothetical protein
MGKREILAALKRKGLEAATCEYEQHICPGEVVGAWTVELTEDSEERILEAGGEVDDLEPDCFTACEVLEWVATLPDCRALSLAALQEPRQ